MLKAFYHFVTYRLFNLNHHIYLYYYYIKLPVLLNLLVFLAALPSIIFYSVLIAYRPIKICKKEISTVFRLSSFSLN